MIDDVYKRYEIELKYFTLQDIKRIELMAVSLTKAEILDFFMIEDGELSKGDERIMAKAINRGISRGIAEASDNLFKNMRDSKSGTAACLSYLKRTAMNYMGEIDDAEGKEGFSYTLNIQTSDKGNTIVEKKEEAKSKVKLKSV